MENIIFELHFEKGLLSDDNHQLCFELNKTRELADKVVRAQKEKIDLLVGIDCQSAQCYNDECCC